MVRDGLELTSTAKIISSLVLNLCVVIGNGHFIVYDIFGMKRPVDRDPRQALSPSDTEES